MAIVISDNLSVHVLSEGFRECLNISDEEMEQCSLEISLRKSGLELFPLTDRVDVFLKMAKSFKFSFEGISRGFIQINGTEQIIGEIYLAFQENLDLKISCYIYESNRGKGYGTECMKYFTDYFLTVIPNRGWNMYLPQNSGVLNRMAIRLGLVPIVGAFNSKYTDRVCFIEF